MEVHGYANTAPTVANAIPDQRAVAARAFSYAFPANTFADADTSHTLTYTAKKSDDTALPSWLTFTASTRTFSGTPQAANVGTLSVKVTASDGFGGTVSDTFDIVVKANSAPTVANAIPDQRALAARAFSYAFPANTFNDADGDTLTYTATKSDNSALPSWLTYTATTRTFSGTPAAADAGTLSVKVTASDGFGGTVSDTFDIVVKALALANHIPDQTAVAGQAFSYAFPANTFAVAISGDTLTYTATKSDGTALPSWLTFTASTRTFSGTPQTANVGTLSVKVTASDGRLSVSDTFDIVVRLNLPPTVANPLLDTTALEGRPFLHVFPANTFADADGDTLTYTATKSNGTALPSWLNFTASTRTFYGTPRSDNVGTLSVKVTAADPGGRKVSDTFNIVVKASNTAPTVAYRIPNQSATTGSAFSYTFPSGTFAPAASGNPLTYTATRWSGSPLPSWLTFNASTRTFSGTPQAANVGKLVVRVTASDGTASVSDIFDIVVAHSSTPLVSNTGKASDAQLWSADCADLHHRTQPIGLHADRSAARREDNRRQSSVLPG